MYSIGSPTASDHPTDMNPSQLANPYSSPFINRPSVFSSTHHQHQPYETVVNPEQPISQPNVYKWPQTSNATIPAQSSGISSMSLPESGVRWKCPDWMANQNLQPGSYMHFNGQQINRFPFKRKATPETDTTIQTKQLITEEKMAATLNGLHLSSEFRAHDINQAKMSFDELFEQSSSSFNACPRTLQDIEEKLKRAQKITVSDVVKSIKEEPILPAAIMERFEKPCKALIIWQPPQRITDLIVPKSSNDQDDDNSDDRIDNNNVGFADANADAQMDLDS